MNIQSIRRLEDGLRQAFPQAQLPADWQIVPEPCPPGMSGDITVNCFRFARFFKSAPDAVAEKTLELLEADPEVSQAERVKAFVNISLRAEALCRDTIGSVSAILEEGKLPEAARKRILVEYSAELRIGQSCELFFGQEGERFFLKTGGVKPLFRIVIDY